MTKIAVTGCAGFIGSWVCDKAIAAGYDVVGIDNLSSGVNYTPKNVQFYEADVNSDIKNILSDVDAVVHCSAYAELRHNWSSTEERNRLFLSNEMATRSVLEQMPDVPFIFLSSASVYGSLSNINNSILYEKDCTPETIESPYAASKLACEAYVSAWSYKRNTPWYCLRLVNQVGARSHRGVITDFYKMAKEKKHIHAADNGSQKKNWVHVEDTADAIIRLLDSKNRVPSGVYTVTSDERWSWRDIVTIMLNMYKEKNPNEPPPFTLTFEDKLAGAIGDPINLYVSGDKLKQYFNCNRKIEQAVKETLLFIDWI